MHFTFDRDRKSGKNQLDHVDKLMKIATSGTEELREEIVAQILKQLTGNPSIESTKAGWRLLLLMCSSFRLGEELHCYVESVCHGQLVGPRESQVEGVVDSALSILRYLHRIRDVGSRRTVPSGQEIECIVSHKCIDVHVKLLNNSYVNILVHPTTLASEVGELMAQYLEIKNLDSFGLAEWMQRVRFLKHVPM
jgi:hypothetical protein